MNRPVSMSIVLNASVAALLATAPWSAAAAESLPRESTVNFTATASVEVTKDQLGITLQAVRDGNDAATVQAQLKQVLEAALAEAKKAGRLTGMNVISVGYSISRELTEKHEAEVTAQAIQKYRSRAASYAQQFGYAGYVVREVSVQSAEQGGGARPYMAQAKSYASSDAPVPVEPGKGTLSATVSGSVALMK